MTSLYKTLLLLTFILTSFLLGLASADYIGKTDVNNSLKTQQSSFNNDGDVKSSSLFSDSLQSIGIFKKDELDLESLSEIYSLIKSDYYDIEGVKKQDIIDGMSKGLVESLGDKHSEFLNLEENENFMKMLSGDFEGIGAVVDKLDFGVKIDRVLKGSPAEKYGLLKDDVIIEADGEELAELSLYDAVAKIKGPAGTSVELKILRAGENEALDIMVIRDAIKIPSIEEQYFEEENLGYIALNIFGESTAQEFIEALESIKQKNVDGLIIDLRNNGGGLLISAVEILSEFVDNGELLVTTKYKNRLFNEVYNSINTGEVFDKKIVVLINGSSASASEITAGALRDYNKAILVGEKTYGKGSVQKPFMFNNGSMLKLTIAKWFTPLDKNIDDEGITPDVEVLFEKQDYNLEACIEAGRCEEALEQKDFEAYDRQLEEAKKVLSEFVSNGNLQVVVDSENERLGNDVEDSESDESDDVEAEEENNEENSLKIEE